MRGYHIRIVLEQKPIASSPEFQTKDTFIPSSLFQYLPAHKAKPINLRNAGSSPRNKDYRFGPIRLDWIDFESMNRPTYSAVGKEKENGRGPAEATFIPLKRTKSGSTNLPEGIVHVFRESGSKSSQEGSATSADGMSDGVMLGVLAVPSWITPSDFLAFVAPASESMAHLRIVRDSVPNRSIVIIQFFNPAAAAEFAEVYNGKPFNSMEPEICNVVHILSVKIDSDDTIWRPGPSQPPMYELPTCPVCLERMDSAITGLITVPCSHTFHCTCLSKWGDSRCPVCRYSQTLKSSHPTSSSARSTIPIPFANPASSNVSVCSSCSSTTNLWICLICGNIGCGRYGRAHAHAHYQATTHLYALELETQRVWDYAGDGYVHRLIQNKADGKLVELPSAASSMGVSSRDGSLGPSTADALSAEKIEAIGIEYSYLLTSQLDSQRSFYEEQSAELTSQVNELRGLMEGLNREFEMERDGARENSLRRQQEEEARITELTRDKLKAENKAHKAIELSRRFEKELKEEKAVSEGLLKNMTKLKGRLEEVEAEKRGFAEQIRDLEEQVRDVMFSLEAKSKIEGGDGPEAEMAGGSVGITLPPSSSTRKKGKKVRGG